MTGSHHGILEVRRSSVSCLRLLLGLREDETVETLNITD